MFSVTPVAWVTAGLTMTYLPSRSLGVDQDVGVVQNALEHAPAGSGLLQRRLERDRLATDLQLRHHLGGQDGELPALRVGKGGAAHNLRRRGAQPWPSAVRSGAPA